MKKDTFLSNIKKQASHHLKWFRFEGKEKEGFFPLDSVSLISSSEGKSELVSGDQEVWNSRDGKVRFICLEIPAFLLFKGY